MTLEISRAWKPSQMIKLLFFYWMLISWLLTNVYSEHCCNVSSNSFVQMGELKHYQVHGSILNNILKLTFQLKPFFNILKVLSMSSLLSFCSSINSFYLNRFLTVPCEAGVVPPHSWPNGKSFTLEKLTECKVLLNILNLSWFKISWFFQSHGGQ